jgi:hypothetical protein
MVDLELANTRMKDFYDVWMLSRKHPFEEQTLAEAIAATFERRRTHLGLQVDPGHTVPEADARGVTLTVVYSITDL